MTPGTLVLLHSPLATAAAWGALPEALRSSGVNVVVPEVHDDGAPPHGGRYVARAALQITACLPAQPLVLVAHSAAGPLLPPLAAAQRAAHRRIGGYVFVDAEFPDPKELMGDWPDAPCGYLRTATRRDTRHADEAHQARLRGWPVRELGNGHAEDPTGAAEALTELIAAM